MLRTLATLALPLLLAACAGGGDKDDDRGEIGWEADPDADGDGVPASQDCDDEDPGTWPGAVEVCDGVDNDCDGVADEDVTVTVYEDGDGDGYGDPDRASEACEAGEGQVDNDLDCDDGDAGLSPEAAELCDDIDNDCDGEIDEEEVLTWYPDSDGDGFGDPDGETVEDCAEVSGYVLDDSDCDDTTDLAHPEATEICDELDNDCDGTVDEEVTTTFYADVDADGWGDATVTEQACHLPTGYAASAGDCDDTDAAVSPDATEVCNEVDDDCDGLVDDADDSLDTGTATTWYADVDGDGYGDADSSSLACEQPSATVTDATDCDDGDAAVNPAATEVCDAADTDEDCSGAADDDDSGVDTSTRSTWYADADSDGYGDASSSTEACDQPVGTVSDATDCDDGDEDVNPGETEICNDLDDDCDGHVDDADSSLDTSTGSTFYEDSDGDGYGDAASTLEACEEPSGYSDNDADCDDDEATVYEGAEELCDGLDNDCDGTADAGSWGADDTCAGESCDDLLDQDSSLGDDDYYLDPDGDGTAELYTCDMTTDGGGWTLVFEWDRYSDGDDLTDFESELTELTNNMGRWDDNQSTYIRWADKGANNDAMAYERDIEVPNAGETLLDVYYYGKSMDLSSTWFFVEAGGSDVDLKCRTDHTRASGTSKAYSTADLSWVPGYTCGTTGSGNWTWNDVYQGDAGADAEVFHLHSLHRDSDGDQSRLYWLALWVR